ncbi:hypothetical protein MKX08_004385 [Trichoderma sp. CBMAI-0020]|nr:hypothetical protein MKX08_004385 [Trichoderma sp. CBMAI-0020]
MADINLQAVHDELVLVAYEAGRMILSANPADIGTGTKLNSVDIVTEVDQAVEKMVSSRLSTAYPEFSFMGEETYKPGTKLGPEPTFVVDPIDGTTNFVHSFPNACISLGVAINREPVIGVIYNPYQDLLFTAIKSHGAYMTRIKGSTPQKLPLASSPRPLEGLANALVAIEWGSNRDGPNYELKAKVFKKLAATKETGGAMVHSLRSLGSAALNIAAVAAGQMDAYWEGGCWAWDVCAGWCILKEAGGIMAGGNPGQWDPAVDERKYLAVRGAPSGQKELVEEFWGVIGDGTMDYSLRTIIPQKDGTRPPDANSNRRKHRPANAVAQLVVHCRRKQREAKAGQAAQHRDGADGAGSVARIRVHHVALDALEADDDAGAKDDGANVGPDPVRVRLGRPRVDEDADGQENGAGDEHGHAELWPAGPAVGHVAALEGGVDAVLQRRADLGAQEEAEAERDVVEARDAGALAVLGGPERGEGRQDQRHDLHNGLRGQQAERPSQRRRQRLQHRPVRAVVLGHEIRVARRLDQRRLLALQQHRRVRLLQEEDARRLDHAAGNRRAVKDPSPRRAVRHPAAGNGPQRRPQQRHQRVDAHGLAPLLGVEQVAQHAAANGQGRRAADAGEEAEDKHLRLGAGEAAAQVEEQEPQVGHLQDDGAAVQLRERPPHQGPEGIGGDEDGEHEGAFDFLGDVQVSADLGKAGGHHGRGHGGDEGPVHFTTFGSSILTVGVFSIASSPRSKSRWFAMPSRTSDTVREMDTPGGLCSEASMVDELSESESVAEYSCFSWSMLDAI